MNTVFQFSIITPDKTLLSGEVAMATIPGSEVEVGVLPMLAPLVSTLKPGLVREEDENGAVILRVAVTQGVVEVTPIRCVVLSETAQLLSGAEEEAAALAAMQSAFSAT